MDVSKNVCDGECQFVFQMKEGYKSLLEKYWCLTKLLSGWYLFGI